LTTEFSYTDDLGPEKVIEIFDPAREGIPLFGRIYIIFKLYVENASLH
jgi:hypothetical protein